MDKIMIAGIKSYGYTGYFPEEKTLGQWFEADVILCLDLSKAGQSDRRDQTIDYCQVIALVQDLIKNSQFDLIEKLAETIAQSLLEKFPCPQVQIILTKVNPPIPDFSGKISIDITRIPV